MRRKLVATLSARFGPLVVGAALITSCTIGTSGETVTTNVTPGETVTYVEELVQCLRTGGADVNVVNSVTFSATVGPGQTEEQLQSLYEACRTEAGPPPERRTDPETAKRVYVAYQQIVECLDELGYAVPEAPSEEVFVDRFVAGEDTWHPYNGLETQITSLEEQIRVEQLCPPWVE